MVTIRAGTGRVRVAEAAVVRHRPARVTVPGERTAGGSKRPVDVPGPPLRLRLVVTRVADGAGEVPAEWRLLTTVPAGVGAGVVGRWYAWRWQIETCHKLRKAAGQNAEEWQPATGAAFLRRRCVASTAGPTVWHLQRDASAGAARRRAVRVRLSGRQMRWGVESTAPARLAGLEKRLASDDRMPDESLPELLALARRVLPTLFHSG